MEIFLAKRNKANIALQHKNIFIYDNEQVLQN